jgi:hypoxanthine phosphoribosyltransferase
MVEKVYISAQELLEDSFRLGMKILKSEFRPNFIVGIWRGGTPVGIAVQEMLDYFHIDTDHISIRTSSYSGIDERRKQIRVHGLNYIVKSINSEDSLLIVDDVYETGLSIKAVIDTLKLRARKNTPSDIRIATVYYKPTKNLSGRDPDFFIHETEKWLIFPHELTGLSIEEINENKPGLKEIFESIPAE